MLGGHTDAVSSAAYSPAPPEGGTGGQQIVTASWDHSARIWFANLDDLLAEARRLIQRDPPIFTPEERQRYRLE